MTNLLSLLPEMPALPAPLTPGGAVLPAASAGGLDFAGLLGAAAVLHPAEGAVSATSAPATGLPENATRRAPAAQPFELAPLALSGVAMPPAVQGGKALPEIGAQLPPVTDIAGQPAPRPEPAAVPATLALRDEGEVPPRAMPAGSERPQSPAPPFPQTAAPVPAPASPDRQLLPVLSFVPAPPAPLPLAATPPARLLPAVLSSSVLSPVALPPAAPVPRERGSQVPDDVPAPAAAPSAALDTALRTWPSTAPATAVAAPVVTEREPEADRPDSHLTEGEPERAAPAALSLPAVLATPLPVPVNAAPPAPLSSEAVTAVPALAASAPGPARPVLPDIKTGTQTREPVNPLPADEPVAVAAVVSEQLDPANPAPVALPAAVAAVMTQDARPEIAIPLPLAMTAPVPVASASASASAAASATGAPLPTPAPARRPGAAAIAAEAEPVTANPPPLAHSPAAVPDAPVSAPLLAAGPDAPVPAAPLAVAATPAPATPPAERSADPRPAAPQLETTIAQVGDLREALRSARPAMTVQHAEFGAVSLRLEQAAPDQWRAILASRDPGFVPAVHAALDARTVAAAADTSTSFAGQGGAHQNGASQNGSGDQRYGAFPNGGQGSSQPYMGQSGSRDGEAAPDHRRPSTAAALAGRSAEAEDGSAGSARAQGGLFA